MKRRFLKPLPKGVVPAQVEPATKKATESVQETAAAAVSKSKNKKK